MLSSVISLLLLQAAAQSGAETAPESVPENALETVEVRSAPLQRSQGSIPGISSLTAADIESEGPTHPNELFDAVPGAWISRGSGQEHLTAVRSPVLTGPGACGAFMVLEDRVPIRPAGFCNVNSLFEVNLLQAGRIDVVRGPGSVIYGSNALHGVLDVSSRDPRPDAVFSGGLEAGSDDYYRGRIGISNDALAFYGNYTTSRSFRVDEQYEHILANGVWLATVGSADVRTQFAFADLDQDTAGFVFGEDAYKDPVLRTSNVNPEAFRKADALRISSRFSWAPSSGGTMDLTPYARSNDMDFLQHFLPGKPLETNNHDSLGMLLSWSPNDAWSAGADVEWADGELVEFQENPTEGSPFLMETRPQGFHYDYSVRQLMVAAWAQYRGSITENLLLTAGIRAEVIDYDYDNHMLSGNTRDDGTECGFGGCLYTRPASRSDDFTNLAPEVGLNWVVTERLIAYTRLARGFRAPQATELYRLQRGQEVADLDSETLDTFEFGLRSSGEQLAWDLAAFVMRKDNFIFRDANGFNVSDGETDHLGIEASLDWQISDHWRFSGNLSWAQHVYAFDRPASGIVKGNAVDTAPEWLAGARLGWQPTERFNSELEWVHMDEYFLEPANEHRYEGHDLLHLRASYALPSSAHIFALRVTNLLDDHYAERADFAFGNYRYFPGAGRRVFLEWRYAP